MILIEFLSDARGAGTLFRRSPRAVNFLFVAFRAFVVKCFVCDVGPILPTKMRRGEALLSAF